MLIILLLHLNTLHIQVIKTIPFDQLNIEILSVEFNLLGRSNMLPTSLRPRVAFGQLGLGGSWGGYSFHW